MVRENEGIRPLGVGSVRELEGTLDLLVLLVFPRDNRQAILSLHP